MKPIYKLFFYWLLLCYSCSRDVTYFSNDTYSAYHLINTYVDTNAPQLTSSFDYGEIFRIDIEFNRDNADFYFSKEFADVSKKNKTKSN